MNMANYRHHHYHTEPAEYQPAVAIAEAGQ